MSKRRKKEGVLKMQRVREILRLLEAGLNQSEISESVGSARSSVQKYIRLAQAHGVSFADAKSLDDAALQERLGGKTPGRKPGGSTLPKNEYEKIDKELARKGITLALLWQEWSASNVVNTSYSTFCRSYNRWARTKKVTLRQQYQPGEKVLIDYAGVMMPVVNRDTGEEIQVPIFVGVLGASYYKYAEATETAELRFFLGSHVRMFDFYGGVPEIAVIDNLKTGVTSACRYDPVLNQSYREFSEHYNLCVLATRSRKPRDKAKVEKAVQDVETKIFTKHINIHIDKIYMYIEKINLE